MKSQFSVKFLLGKPSLDKVSPKRPQAGRFQAFFARAFFSQALAALAIFGVNLTAYAAPSVPPALRNERLIYCTDGADFSFNPQRAEAGSNLNVVTEQLYDKLIAFDPASNQLKPALAERFMVSEDGRILTLHLRKKVAFHHTPWFTPSRPFNAEDVVFSLQRMMGSAFELPELSAEQQATLARYHINSERAAKAYFPYFESVALKDRIAAIRVIDPHTVELTLRQPDPALPYLLASQHAVMLSKEYALQLNADNNLAQLNRLPIGTGAYQMQDFAQNDHVRLVPNPNYWGEKAKIAHLIVDFSATSTGRMARFLNNECDLVAFPEPSQLAMLDPKQGYLVQTEGANLAFLAFNFWQPQMQAVKLRQKIARAINRPRLANLLFYQTASVAENVLPKVMFNRPNPTGYPYLPDASLPNLADSEPPQNSPKIDRLKLWVIDEKKVYNPHPLKMAELIRTDLAKVGIALDVRQVSRAYLVQQLEQKAADYDLILGGWLASDFELNSFFTPLLGCEAAPTVTNLSNWCDPEFDRLLAQTNGVSAEHSQRLAADIEQHLQEKLPILPLVNSQRLLLAHHRVQNVQLSPFGQVNLSRLRLDNSLKTPAAQVQPKP